MASLSALTSASCRNGQPVITLSDVSPGPGSPATSFHWTILAPDGTDYGSYFTPDVLPVEAQVPNNATYSVRVYATADDGTQYVSSIRSYPVSCGPAPLAITNLAPVSPIAPATTGSVDATAFGGTAPYAVALDGGAALALTGTAIHFDGLAPGSHTLTLTDANGGTATASFTIAAAGLVGCTTPRALNYDPTATQDDTPSLCVFVDVTTGLDGLVAAHLPIPVVVRASPTLAGLASIVVLYLETADTLAGPWVEFGRLRQVCDATATVRFDLSEAAKSLLRIGVPVESGIDTALSALLRARYEVLDPVTLTPTYAGDVGACRALNAVVEPVGSPAVLTTPTPYAELPDGAALWSSTATLADGVLSTALALPATGCRCRQFVWLNAAGAWDSGYFFGRHVHGTDQADPIAFRDLAGADRYARRGTVRPTLQVYSDRLDWATFRAIRGVRDSVQVWERIGPNEYAPVLVSTESYQEYQEVTDKTYNVNFTVSYAAQLIQTQ